MTRRIVVSNFICRTREERRVLLLTAGPDREI